MNLSTQDRLIFPDLLGAMFVTASVAYEKKIPGFLDLLESVARACLLAEKKGTPPDFLDPPGEDGEGWAVSMAAVDLKTDSRHALQEIFLRLSGQAAAITDRADPWLSLLLAIKSAVSQELTRRGGWVEPDGGRIGVIKGNSNEKEN